MKRGEWVLLFIGIAWFGYVVLSALFEPWALPPGGLP